MTDEPNKTTALVKYEPQTLALRERIELYAELKRAEFEDALEKGHVRDPVSIAISIGISLAVSAASMALTYALTPGPKPVRRGELSGEVQGLMRSEQGILINEIYGGDPGDGKGGVKIPATIIWASKIRKSIQVERQETGGGKGFGGGRTQTIENVIYDLDWAAMGGRGPLVLKREWANADKIMDLDKRGIYEGEDSANTFTAPSVVTNDSTASDGREITLQGANPATSAVQFNSVTSNGAATRELTIYYVNTGTISGEVILNGGAPQAVSFPNSSNSRSSIVVSVALNNGANTIKIRNLSLTLNLRIDRIFCFPGFSETDRSTGIEDTGVAADPTYNPGLPPDPTIDYPTPIARHNEVPARDGYGAFTGATNVGGYSEFAVYPGNTTQLQDPVIQADLDGKYGANSTPAFRKRAYSRHSAFTLTRWGGVMPNISQLWEHETFKNWAQICGQWCDRVGFLSTDYDFSGVVSVKVRGLLVSGRRYQPAEIMAEGEDVYDVFYTENDGQILCLLQANAPTITIPESEIGWAEDDESEEIPGINSSFESEIDLLRRVDVKSIDPDREFEPNTQGEARQITKGERSELLEVSITLTDLERRAVATRKLYRDYTRGGSHPFTLSWTYLYLYAGYIINTTKNGIAISMQLTAIKGGISILECEAENVETAVLTQSPSTSGGGVFERPPAPIPQMTIAALMDTPLLRDRDETENNGVGFYAAATPRTGDGVWTGASLYVFKVGWERIADFTLPATMGRQVLANGAAGALPTGSAYYFDTDPGQTPNTITVDFFGTLAPPASAPAADVLNGANALLVGDEVIQYTTATQVGGQPNRWTFSGLLRGRRGTEYAMTTHVLNERVVVLNEAVKFIPMNAFDLNRAQDYRMVSSGQSLDDAATIEDFVWTGRTLQPLAHINHKGTRDSQNSLLIEFDVRTRLGGGLRSYQAGALNEETEEHRVQILNSGSTTLPNGKERVISVYVGTPMAAMFESDSTTGKFGNIAANSLTLPEFYIGAVNARAFQLIEATGNETQARLDTQASGGGKACFGIVPAAFSWRGASLTNIRSAAHIWIEYDNALIPPRLTVYEYGVSKYTLNSPEASRYRIAFAGSEVRVYKDWTGSAGELIYLSPKEQIFPYAVLARGEEEFAFIQNVTLTTRPFAKTIYSYKQQTEDGFTPGTPNQMDTWEHSRAIGPGIKTRVTL